MDRVRRPRWVLKDRCVDPHVLRPEPLASAARRTASTASPAGEWQHKSSSQIEARGTDQVLLRQGADTAAGQVLRTPVRS